MNILFVEDDPALRYSIAREMRAHGHTVHEADSAEIALVLLAEHEIEILVADIGLPGEAGDVFAAEARVVRPELGIVFATGKDMGEGANRRDGGPTVVQKPYTWESLAVAFERLD